MLRAYSLVTIKEFDGGRRTFNGIATSPVPDRVGDVIEPAGVKFKNPLPLLLYHDSHKPVGETRFGKNTSDGTPFAATISTIDRPGVVKDRLDEAVDSLNAKPPLIRGVSIGFRPLEAPVYIKETGGFRYPSVEVLELSMVVIPAHQDATIAVVKSLDSHAPAASGTGRASRSTPGASGSSKVTPMNVAEQIVEKRSLLQTKSTRLEELMADQETNGGLEAEQETELGTVTKDVDALTKSLANLETLERAQMLNLKRIESPAHTLGEAPGRTKIAVKELEKGTLFTRYAMSLAAGKGSISDTIEYAKRFTNTPELVRIIKAEAGTAVVQSPGWGGELVNPDTMQTEFVELLRPQTIIGRVNGFRRVPFNIPIVTQTGGSTFNWVGEAAPKPVGELAFDRTTMSWSKVAGIVVLSQELVRLSTPNAESTVRQDLIEQCAKFLDEQFIQVGIAPGASNPASITYGVASPTATGTTAAALRHDLNIALANFDSNGVTTEGLVIVMTPALARGISLLVTSLGVPEFPGMTPNGGTLLGYPVIASASVDSGTVVIFKPSEILLADDGRVTIDASNQASIDLSGSTSATFSLWQNNCVGLRAEQWIRWQKRRAAGIVAVIDTAAYAPA